jgi:hypothetical protein
MCQFIRRGIKVQVGSKAGNTHAPRAALLKLKEGVIIWRRGRENDGHFSKI